MYREFLTNKWVLSGIVFLILFSFSCFLWYEYETAPYKQEAIETAELLLQRKTPSNIGSEMEQATNSSALDNTTQNAEKPVTQTRTETVDKITGVEVAQEKQTEPSTDNVVESDVRVSPFGFGPYPKIPEGFPEPDIFDSLETMGNSDMRKALELQKRLIVEFYKQGISLENVGVRGKSDGRVYLSYPNVVYVTWDYWTDEDGITHKYAGVVRGHPDATSISKPFLDKGEMPPDITVYELPDGYVDAYEVLGLAR
ncbi:hypothetical protein JT359_09140 [Candidatus Poribacteria bacterium]|nr:hypothetical protein [Candidatus Poribacteria bacterium]